VFHIVWHILYTSYLGVIKEPKLGCLFSSSYFPYLFILNVSLALIIIVCLVYKKTLL